MKKPIIAVDIDDVLAASTEALRLEVNRRLGTNLTAEHYKIPSDHYWGYYEKVWEQHDIHHRISLDQLDPQMKADQSHILPQDDSLRVLRNLADRFDFAIVTGRGYDWAEATHKWLEHHFPGIFSTVLLGGGKDGLNERDKGQLCRDIGAEWLIDDSVEHAQSAARRGINVILFGEYGWQHEVPAEMVRCHDWKAVQEYFNGLGS